jgi:hypothetical protein
VLPQRSAVVMPMSGGEDRTAGVPPGQIGGPGDMRLLPSAGTTAVMISQELYDQAAKCAGLKQIPVDRFIEEVAWRAVNQTGKRIARQRQPSEEQPPLFSNPELAKDEPPAAPARKKSPAKMTRYPKRARSRSPSFDPTNTLEGHWIEAAPADVPQDQSSADATHEES